MACADLGGSARQGDVKRHCRHRPLKKRVEDFEGTYDREAVNTLRDVQRFDEICGRQPRVALAQDRADLRRCRPSDQERDQRISV